MMGDLRQRIADLEKELDITDKLLTNRQEVIDMIPPCPVHGAGCLPYAKKWIKRRLAEQEASLSKAVNVVNRNGAQG